MRSNSTEHFYTSLILTWNARIRSLVSARLRILVKSSLLNKEFLVHILLSYNFVSLA